MMNLLDTHLDVSLAALGFLSMVSDTITIRVMVCREPVIVIISCVL